MDKKNYKLITECDVERLIVGENFILEIYDSNIFFEHRIYKYEKTEKINIIAFDIMSKMSKKISKDSIFYKFDEINIEIVRLYNIYRFGVSVLNSIDYRKLHPKKIEELLSSIGILKKLDRYGNII